MDKEKTIKILKKANELQKGKELFLAKEFIELNDKIDSIPEKIDLISEELKQELKKKLESELVLEIDREELRGDKGEDGKDGNDGKDYILTDKDKKEIASSIKVPIVEKVIEKTEVIKEQPIVINEIKEVAITDTGEVIVEKINELPINEDVFKIDFTHIKNVPEFKGSNISKAVYQLSDVNIQNLTNNQVLKYNSTTNLWENGTGGGSTTWGSITGTLSAQTDLQTVLNGLVPYVGAIDNVDLGIYGLRQTVGGAFTSVQNDGTELVLFGNSNDGSGSIAFGNQITNLKAIFRTTDLSDNRFLDIPDNSGTLALTSDLSSYVPTSRTLTINGTTYDLSANRSWTISGGVTALSAIGSSPNANGATITGSTLNLQPASASFGGVVTTGSQTFAGSKVFTSAISSPGSGSNSERFGLGSLASGTGAVAFGYGANASDDNVSIGYNSSATGGFGSVTIGGTTNSFYSTAIGKSSSTTSLYGTVIGYASTVGYLATGIGVNLTVPDFAVFVGASLSGGAVNIGYNNSSVSSGFTLGQNLTASDRELHMGVNLTGYRFTDLWFTGGKESVNADTYGPLRLHAVRGNGTNNKGQDLVMQPGASTGNLTGGSFKVETAPAGASGTTLGTSTTILEIDGAGNSIFSGVVRMKSYTVAGLPAGVNNDRAFVTDALVPVWGSTVTGGGTVRVPVYYDGTWKVG